jgi:hypothetical protein
MILQTLTMRINKLTTTLIGLEQRLDTAMEEVNNRSSPPVANLEEESSNNPVVELKVDSATVTPDARSAEAPTLTTNNPDNPFFYLFTGLPQSPSPEGNA